MSCASLNGHSSIGCQVTWSGRRGSAPARPLSVAREAVQVSSGDEQAKAEFRLFPVEDAAIAFGPRAGRKIGPELAYRPVFGSPTHGRPHRYPTADALLQICLRPPPVRLEESVDAVPRNGHRLHPGTN